MSTLQTSMSQRISVTKIPLSDMSTMVEQDMLADMQMVARLLEFGQLLSQKMQEGVTDLCHEVRRITQERAYLHLGCKKMLTWQQIPPNTLITIPIQFGHISYGTLCITHDAACTTVPSMSVPIARLFAQACGWLLHTLEQSLILQEQCQHLELQAYSPLSKREREVLQLMYQGCDREKIVSLLSIAPATLRKHQQHIYERLGVHNERDAVLAAYQGGLLSLFAEDLPS